MSNPGGKLPRTIAAPETILIDHASRLAILERIITGGGIAVVTPPSSITWVTSLTLQDVNGIYYSVSVDTTGRLITTSLGNSLPNGVFLSPPAVVSVISTHYMITVDITGRLITTNIGTDPTPVSTYALPASDGNYFQLTADANGHLVTTNLGPTLPTA